MGRDAHVARLQNISAAVDARIRGALELAISANSALAIPICRLEGLRTPRASADAASMHGVHVALLHRHSAAKGAEIAEDNAAKAAAARAGAATERARAAADAAREASARAAAATAALDAAESSHAVALSNFESTTDALEKLLTDSRAMGAETSRLIGRLERLTSGKDGGATGASIAHVRALSDGLRDAWRDLSGRSLTLTEARHFLLPHLLACVRA